MMVPLGETTSHHSLNTHPKSCCLQDAVGVSEPVWDDDDDAHPVKVAPMWHVPN